MKLSIYGGAAGIEVSDQNFSAPFNEALIHQVITAYRAGGRAGTKAQKTRAEVRGGGSKPWRQKGTGQARAGTSRGPIWVGGGRAFAAKPRDFAQKVNRKMYRAAMRGILSTLVREERLVIVDDMRLDQPRTRDLVARLSVLGLDHVLILVDKHEEKLHLAARNLPWAEVLTVAEMNPLSLVSYDKVLATADAVRGIEERLK
ncbi:MAG: 50S ribosomal protein L4 [Gammaproteobacteria bacterium]|nr:MAG: 50S ribosomal protein L4 [Gammaproteobacteria bacterium]